MDNIDELDYSTIACFLPKDIRKVRSYDKYFYPGVALIVKEI